MLRNTYLFLLSIAFICMAGLPRYSPSLLEVSLGGGAQGASIETNYLSSAQNQTIGRFYIGGALNPLWFFVSDDKPGPLHYFDVFINAGYNLMGTTALYDTSYIQTQGYYTENRNFSVTYQPSSFNLGSNLKLGLLPFLDIAGGVGLNIGNESMLFQESMVLPNGNTLSNDSTVKAHSKTSFYIDFGLDAYLPQIPFAKLGVYLRKDFRSASLQDYYENDVRPANFNTEVSNTGLQFRAVATFSLRGESDFRIRQRTASRDFDNFISSLSNTSQTADIDALTANQDSLQSKYQRIVVKKDYTSRYDQTSTGISNRIEVLRNEFSQDSSAATQSVDARYSFYSKYRNSRTFSAGLSSVSSAFFENDYNAAQSSGSTQKYERFIAAYTGLPGANPSLVSKASTELDSISTMSEIQSWKAEHSADLARIKQLEQKISSNRQKLSSYESIAKKYQTYRIVGKIKDLSGTTAQIWGVAVPDQGLDGYNPGAVLQEGNVIVRGISPSGHRGANIYEGHHCYKDKTYGTGNFGQKVEIFIFGECSPEKTKADRQISYINQENEKHEQEIENIKRSIGYHDAVKKLNSIR